MSVYEELRSIAIENEWELAANYYGRYGTYAENTIHCTEESIKEVAEDFIDSLRDKLVNDAYNCGMITDGDKDQILAKFAVIKASLKRLDSLGKEDSIFEVEI